MSRFVPKTMPKGEMAYMVRMLYEIRESATMKGACLFPLPDEEGEMDDLRELTQSYRNSYLVQPLDELIQRYEERLGYLPK